VLDVDIAGDSDPLPVLEREWVKRAQDEADPRKRLEIVVQGAAAVVARTAAIKEVVRDAAATDPAAAALLAQDTARRHATQSALVDIVLGDGQPGPGVDRDAVAATFFAVVNNDTHRLLVGHLGWTVERWTAWLLATLERQILSPGEVAPGC
jgi:hypothetical protein